MYLYILQLPYYRHKQTVFEVHPTEVQFTVHNSSVSIEVYTVNMYMPAPENTYAPPFCTLLSGISGEVGFAQIFNWSHAYTPHPTRFLAMFTWKVDNHNNYCGFLEERQLH